MFALWKSLVKRFPPKGIAWVLMALFCLPLLLLLGLQYLALTRSYEENRRATLANLNRYVDIMVKKTALTYTTKAESWLSVPAEDLHQEAMTEMLRSRQKAETSFARYFFFLVFSPTKYEFYVYDLREAVWIPNPLPTELRSVALAGGHWHLRNKKGFPPPNGFQTNHDLLDHPSIMKIIVDGEETPRGLTGLILDPDYFVSQFLESALPNLLAPNDSTRTQSQVYAEVLDGQNQIRLSTKQGQVSSKAMASGYFHLIFTDWAIRIFADDRLESQAKLALRWGIALAIFLSLLPAMGVAYTLRAMLKYRQLSTMKSDFVANVSHELRTPITSIHLLGEMMRTGKVNSPDKVQEYGNLIELESDRLVSLIDNILHFGKIEAGHQAFQMQDFDLTSCLKETLAAFRSRPDLAQVQFQLQVPTNPIIYWGEETSIKQALINLLDNAVKYGPPTQTVTLACSEDSEKIHLLVKDQGPGIAKEERALIFERFYRIGEGNLHSVRGHGLGLTIARQLAQGHGGHLTARANPGGGSCFDLTLPKQRSV